MTSFPPSPPDMQPPERAPSMRFLYALAAVCVGAALLAPSKGQAEPTPPAPSQSSGEAIGLRPDQKRAIELTLGDVDPAQRPFLYEQMAKNIAPYDEAQIARLIEALELNASRDIIERAKAAAMSDAPVEGALSAADFEHNRAQYEPVIRKRWEANKRFDAFVNARLDQHCPQREALARWGPAWRYELIGLHAGSSTASANADIDVSVLGSTYAPQDGRYTFDFSKARFSFDETAVDAAIRTACAAYAKKGEEFLAKLDPMIARKDWEGAHRLEQAAMAGIDPIRARLNAELERLSPDYGYPVMEALQNGVRVK